MVSNGTSWPHLEPAGISALEAAGRNSVLQSTNLGPQVAYQSQFNDWTNRAHAGKERIKSRLIVNLDADEWDLPPKPKWMRWKTYEGYTDRFDRYEETFDFGCAVLAEKLGLR